MHTFPCIPFEQNGTKLFLFTAPAKFVYQKFDVSRRIENKEKGYQRSFSQTRIKQLQRYIDKESGILPNSILVNIDDGNWVYDEEKNNLKLKEVDSIGLIIDGQHRVWGANEAQNELNLPVVATVGLDVVSQAKLFITINKTQRGVPVSLYLDLLNLTEGVIEDYDDPEVPAKRRAIEITQRLNEDNESALYGLVRTTGETGHGISLNEFVSKLTQYVDPKQGKLLNFGFEQQYKIFKIYFRAIKAVFLEEWENPNSLILKTVGFGGLMHAFSEIFSLVTQRSTSFSTENTINVLRLIGDFKFNSETLPGGGVKSQENAGKILINKIKIEMRNSDELNVNIED